MLIEDLSRLGEGDPVLFTVKKVRSEVLFQFLDLEGYGRLGQIKFLGDF